MLLWRLNFYQLLGWNHTVNSVSAVGGSWNVSAVNKEIFRWGNYLGIFFNVDFVSKSTTWHNLHNYSINCSEESFQNANTVEKFPAIKKTKNTSSQLSKLILTEFSISPREKIGQHKCYCPLLPSFGLNEYFLGLHFSLSTDF